jgi:hypothetical protein
MAVMCGSYTPPIIEDIRMLQKEHANGLYSPLPFMVANFVIGLPWLFLIALIFSSIVYWLTNFDADLQAYLTFTAWLYLDLLAAESVVVLISAIVPQFVTALAVISFAQGLWLATDGFLVPINTLNSFWKYGFHYVNYQAYVFQGMMVNQFKHTTYDCQALPEDGWHCLYLSDLADQGQIRGTAVLDSYDYGHEPRDLWKWVGTMAAIIVVHRLLALVVLYWRVRR